MSRYSIASLLNPVDETPFELSVMSPQPKSNIRRKVSNTFCFSPEKDAQRYLDLFKWLYAADPVTYSMLPSKYRVTDPLAPSQLRGRSFHIRQFRKSRVKLSPDVIEALKKIHFVWDAKVAKFKPLLIALKCYKDLNGDVNVPQKFTVPHGDTSWPKSIWGLKLGDRVHNIRIAKKTKLLPKWKIQMLKNVGFKWTLRQFITFDTKIAALRAFHDAFGHLDIEQSYVLPNEHVNWDRGHIKLGQIVNKLRGSKDKMSVENKQQLDRIGFKWTAKTRRYGQDTTCILVEV